MNENNEIKGHGRETPQVLRRTLLKYGEDFYCRHKEESRWVEESRLNEVGELNWTVRGEKSRQSKRGSALSRKAAWAKRPRGWYSQRGRVI